MVERPEIPCYFQEGRSTSSSLADTTRIRDTLRLETEKNNYREPFRKNCGFYALSMKQKLGFAHMQDATEKEQGLNVSQ
jgi:hypothetical protein